MLGPGIPDGLDFRFGKRPRDINTLYLSATRGRQRRNLNVHDILHGAISLSRSKPAAFFVMVGVEVSLSSALTAAAAPATFRTEATSPMTETCGSYIVRTARPPFVATA